MTHHTDAGRAAFEAWARGYGTWEVKRDDDVALGTTGYTDITLTVAWHAVQAARRAPAAPVPQVDAIGAALELESRTKLVESQTTERAMLHAANCLRLLAAAPQPPEATVNQQLTVEAAPVQMPEPVAYQWLSTDNFRISGGPVSGAYWNKLYTEQQVRELLANHGIQERST